MTPSDLEHRARAFATKAHADIGQVRKYTGEPYIVHPAAVVEIVRSVTHDIGMLAAAWLHDVAEDTPVTIAKIREEFGSDVALLVQWLTDVSQPADGNRAQRKAVDREHLRQAPTRAQTIKVADLIDNSSTILGHDPAFARVYLAEKQALLEVLVLADPELIAIAERQIEGALA